jgi:hypothetical protein
MALPRGALAKVCNYTLTLWNKLTRFLGISRTELSNNLEENSMRPSQSDEKTGSHTKPWQDRKIAAILSIVESCRRLKLPVRDYLGRDSSRARRSPHPAHPQNLLRPHGLPSSRCSFPDFDYEQLKILFADIPQEIGFFFWHQHH